MLVSTRSIPGFSEPVNAMSHLGGAAVFLALGWKLVRKGRGNFGRVLCLAVFACCCVLLLAISGVYHLIGADGTAHIVLRRLDHAAIYLLIAGTFTPVHGILFTGAWRTAILAFVWIAAVTGIALQSVFLERMPPWLSVTFYLALGWVGLISAWKLYRQYGWAFVAPLVYGGVAYTLGAACLGLGALIDGLVIVSGAIGRHEIFHFAVLAGIGFHWKFVDSFASGIPVLSRPLRNEGS